MNQPLFHALYDTPARTDLALIGPEQLQTNDSKALRTYAVRLWLDVYLLQMSVDILRSRYADLVSAARNAVAGTDLDELRRELEFALDDPDLPVNYQLTPEALAFLGSAAGRRS